MTGRDVLFVCATDEHGTPIAVKAEKEGKSPKEIAGRYYQMIKKDLESCNISLDNFSRTTDPLHYEIAQNFFLNLYNNDYIYEKAIKQPYCDECNRFLPDRYVEGICPYCSGEGARGDHCEVCGRHLDPIQLQDPHCLICNTTPEIRESTQYYFRLSQFEDEIKTWIVNNQELPANVKNYALQWIKEGLKDWILTRDMEWGIPVPLEEAKGKIIYVWLEALLEYITSAVIWSRENKKSWKEYWDDKAVHFIGKDIIYHHSIFWPALLMAYGCKLPYTIIAGEYLSLEGQKMSTSKNWVIWTSDFLNDFEPDILRYYLLVNAPLTRDTDFSWEDFQRRINDELADVLGNFLHRTFSFTTRFYQGKIPEPAELDEYDDKMLNLLHSTPAKISDHIENFKFREGLVELIKVAKSGNKYFNDKEPWKNIKSSPQKAENCLYICNQMAKMISILLQPYLPDKSREIIEILNIEEEFSWESASQKLPPGHEINNPSPIFTKIEDQTIQNKKRDLYKNLGELNEMKHIISIEDFAKLEFRVGKIIGAEKIKGSESLLKLMVDVKDKQLQVVAGLANKYPPDEILNKKVIVLVNLKPAKLFGVKSEGMILATGDTLSVLSAEGAEIGEKIK
jgi:methionyl-tRNA synthetase